MNIRKYLVFTCVGDNDKQYLTWATNASKIYDRAINYYGHSKTEFDFISSLNTEYHFKSKGMVFKCFADHYHYFTDYDYVLICDSDLEIDPLKLEETFKRSDLNNWTACSWSRKPNDSSSYDNIFLSLNKGIRSCNFIEMLFMIIRKDLLKLLVGKWNELHLSYSTGVDIILSNVAYHNNMLPFYIIDDYTIYNPRPEEKISGKRELERTQPAHFLERSNKLYEHIFDDPEYWKIHDTFIVGNEKHTRFTIDRFKESFRYYNAERYKPFSGLYIRLNKFISPSNPLKTKYLDWLFNLITRSKKASKD